jgi:hypothetical protein
LDSHLFKSLEPISDASCRVALSSVPKSGWQPDVLPAAFSRVLDPRLPGSWASGRLLLKSLGPKKKEKLGDGGFSSAVWSPKLDGQALLVESELLVLGLRILELKILRSLTLTKGFLSLTKILAVTGGERCLEPENG